MMVLHNLNCLSGDLLGITNNCYSQKPKTVFFRGFDARLQMVPMRLHVSIRYSWVLQRKQVQFYYMSIMKNQLIKLIFFYISYSKHP